MPAPISLPCILATAFGLGLLSLPAAAQATPYGSGINPAGSLDLTSGSPQIGASFQLTVRNTAVANPLPGQAFLSLSTQPAPGFPGGLLLPGLGLAFPGATGELLVDVVAPNPFLTLGPETYLGGSSPGAVFNLGVPFKPALIGLDLFAQGLLLTPAQNFSLGLTNGLEFQLGAAQFPGLVLIPSGTFQMGTNAASVWPYYSSADEKPVHSVTISYSFWMGSKEVTQAQYQALMGTNPAQFPGANNPVESVSWIDAQAYCAALTAQQAALGSVPAGYQYRLPTEAEWEYACRAGTTTEFNVGAALLCNQARFFFSDHTFSQCGGNGTVPVGSYAPNPWGLYDMHSNVSEWCLDSESTYSAAAATDPFVTGGTYRIYRGGSWVSSSNYCRSAKRLLNFSNSKPSSMGFRVVLAPVLVP
jgi:formylglycine-generating enzyme required for sulfatase activity